MGRVASCRIPFIKNSLIRWFIGRYNVDINIAASNKLADYQHFNAFFTRHLKPDARPLLAKSNQLACPVDGTISEAGYINNHTLLQAKGRTYQLSQLLADTQTTKHFQNGSFNTIYLSPTDYHRVHIPCNATLLSMTYIPGKLFSVNPKAANGIDNLFARNERVVCLFDTQHGKMAMVFVGAMIVGSIATSWHGVICPPHTKSIKTWQYAEKNIAFKQGDEIGYFQFGSTVIVLTEKQWQWLAAAEDTVHMGQVLAESTK